MSTLQVTVFTGQPDVRLTKAFTLSKNGVIHKYSAPFFTSGSARKTTLECLSDIEPLTANLRSNQALATGIFDQDDVRIVTSGQFGRDDVSGNVRTRSLNYMTQPSSGFLLLDYDTSPYMPEHFQCNRPGEVMEKLATAVPELADIGYAGTTSTSAGIFVAETGQAYPSTGFHIYLAAQGIGIATFQRSLEVRLWNAGLGYIAIARNGALLSKTFLDLSVLSPERLIFEAPPVLGEGLERHPRQWTHREGKPVSGAFHVSDEEVAKYRERVSAARSNSETLHKSRQIAMAYAKERAPTVAAKLGISVEKAVEVLVQRNTGAGESTSACLALSDEIDIGYGKLISIRELLEHQSEFDGKAIPDPVEGSAYGNGTAIFYANSGKIPRIHSLAHGQSTVYEISGFDYEPYEVIYREVDNSRRQKKSSANKPVIRIEPGQLPELMDKAVKSLAASDPPLVFQRSRTLCRVANIIVEEDVFGCRVPKGTAQIVTLNRAGLAVELSRSANWERISGKCWVPSDPCPKVCGALPDAIGYWGDIPVLQGISEVPLLLADGTLYSKPGYDRQSKLFVQGGYPDLHLPDVVSWEDAVAAAHRFLHFFREFPFEEPDLDRSVLLAYAITLLLRPQLATAPLFCFSARAPGSGKGLLVESINLAIRGKDAATMPPVNGTGSEDETRKRITALLVQGVTSINLDNYSKPIGGDSMNALLTATEWNDRLLGSSTTVSLPTRTTLAATGNNLAVRGDMVRRSLIVQLDAGVERPELREFEDPDLLHSIMSHRGGLLTDVFTILKGYQQAGQPGVDKNLLGRFEQWTRAVCAPIRWLGFPDPLLSQVRLQEQDPEMEKLSQLLSALYAHFDTQWFTAGDAIEEADNTHSASLHMHMSDLRQALEEIASDGRRGLNRKLLGWYLKRNEGRIADGLKLERRDRGNSKSKNAQEYRVAQVTPAGERG